ncbi:xanthine dehydrogenase family protein molybdopterin-binding subunit [Engelhardtia mirabilis]|uniref:Caffeine dehydrogenase subunit alpha n=1 Tax=Engelhardtia mirabilis TaxID=2528011 RepID=A0A518BS48_9BACT|nr:Caffeine dehydrogenase subunit alpha [Planctomycetes bacterium Pla133]QDV04122.1 Caffeine dehydrogenase subunit alpha [Planctomycetes bacterium Pla86]
MSPTPKWKPRGEMTLLNTGYARLDGPDKVTGRAVYSHDVRLPRQVYARLVLHSYPRAELTSLDLEPARRIPGVVLVEAQKAAGDELVYLGDDSIVAYVAAETPEAAKDAARAVRAAFRDHYPPMVTREQSLSPGAPSITGRGNTSGARDRGDEAAVDSALEGAAVVVEQVYELPIQHHVCLETHGHVVDYDGESATCYASTQAVSGSVDEFARNLGLPADKVRVLTPVMGGGFGAKFGIGLEGAICCLIAKKLLRPVHLMLDRPQEFQMAGNRSGTWVRMRGGIDAQGRLVGQFAEVDRLGGTGGGAFPLMPYIYACETNAARTRSVHTALDSNRAMRAPGHPQASFAQESFLDELAYAAGLDPVEVRKVNVESDVYRRHLDVVADAIGWDAHPNRTAPGEAGADGWAEGIGFGLATWRAGGRPGCEVEVRITPDGAVTSSCAVQDLGTGSRTLVAAIIAEELGLPLSAVTARIGDSDLPPSVGSGGSVTTGALAPALKVAAHRAREALEQRLVPVLGAEVGDYEWVRGRVRVAGEGDMTMSFGEVCALLGNQPLSVRGEYDGSLDADGSLHGAQAARVRVDTLTGRVEVLDMVATHDQGIPLNRLALTSQINGGMIQALSYGLLEERVLDAEMGWLLSDNLESYKIAGPKEMPRLRVILDEDDGRNLATGMAEAPVIPGHSAIANAIFNACGARLRSLPFTPDRVLAALAERA